MWQQGALAPADCSGTGNVSDQSTFLISSLAASTLYTFRVCSQNSNATLDNSSGLVIAGQTLQAPPPNVINLSVASTPSGIELSWTSGGGTTDSYVVAYRAGSTPPTHCLSANGITFATTASTTLLVSNLSPASTFSFRVCAASADTPPSYSGGVTTSGISRT